MRETLLDYISKSLIIEKDCSVHFGSAPWRFYLNGIDEVYVLSIYNNHEQIVCNCINDEGTIFHITTPEYLYVNKLDTKAAKILFMKGRK